MNEKQVTPINVLVVDDHVIVREGLTTLLEAFPDLKCVGEAENGELAIRRCEEEKPDVVLMDLMMPVMDGVGAIRAIRQRFPQIQILALTNFKNTELVQNALAAGATGYLLKNISADDLAGAIRAAAAGRTTMAPEATETLVEAMTAPPRPGHDLTDRERDVLQLVVAGMSNPQIALELEISPSTVKNHLSHIFHKLDVASRTEAATLALTHDIVAPP